jgi:hypothetical protein
MLVPGFFLCKGKKAKKKKAEDSSNEPKREMDGEKRGKLIQRRWYPLQRRCSLSLLAYGPSLAPPPLSDLPSPSAKRISLSLSLRTEGKNKGSPLLKHE